MLAGAVPQNRKGGGVHQRNAHVQLGLRRGAWSAGRSNWDEQKWKEKQDSLVFHG